MNNNRNQKKRRKPGKKNNSTPSRVIPPKMKTAALVSLGCAKNLTLTEEIIAQLGLCDYVVTPQPQGADLVIVNTCGFILDAREESKEIIREMARYRRIGVIGFLVVYGCMVQGFAEDLQTLFPEVDLFVGSDSPDKLVSLIRNRTVGSWLPINWAPPSGAYQPRLYLTPQSYSYLRISDGCSNCCNYCAIPRLRGPLRSRPSSIIMKEAREAVRSGRSEVVLIGQDLASYAADRGKPELPKLVKKLSALEGIEWIRLLYLHPRHLSDDIIELFGNCDKVVPYVDLPVQHLTNKMLTAMGRHVTYEEIEEIVSKLKAVRPDIAIRTSIIVGFPGETEEDVELLMTRLEKLQFSHIGVFTYSHEPETPAFDLGDEIPQKVKEQRRNRVMEFAQKQAFLRNENRVGELCEVLVDGITQIDGVHYSMGRTMYEAPEVDGLVFLTPAVAAGCFVEAKIIRADGYDVFGEIIFEEDEETEE